jgi:abhydrolase domain-containing protein 10
VLNKNIDVLLFNFPTRIIHGVQDETVPFEQSLKLMELLKSDDVDLVYRKTGQHRLSEPEDLKLISKTLDDLLDQLKDK